MANYTEISNIRNSQFVTASSRYINSKVIYYTENKILTFNTYKRRLIEPSARDKNFYVKPEFEYRPDLVSYRAYGTVDFWWKIMEANEIKDIFDFKTGLNIIIPQNIY